MRPTGTHAEHERAQWRYRRREARPASCVFHWQASAAVAVAAFKLVPVVIVAIHRPPSVRVAFAVASWLFPPVACVRGRRSLSPSRLHLRSQLGPESLCPSKLRRNAHLLAFQGNVTFDVSEFSASVFTDHAGVYPEL